jgi:CDGSH-type Zn-finger protein/ferredoxin
MAIRIELVKNGPIKLSAEGEDFPVLRANEDSEIKAEGPAFLCRCGASRNKPFCDGAHASEGYSDENRCENDALQSHEAPGITVHFNRAICSGAAKCVRNLPEVFVSDSEDWIHPEKASVDEVIATVSLCPSGALTYTLAGQTRVRENSKVSVNIVKNGPYEVTGPVKFDAPRWSQNASKTNFALCRCGKSSNSPFCDYSHGEKGWRDSD